MVDRALLHREHLVLDRLDQRQIPVDDKVEDRMQDIVDAMFEQRRRRLKLRAQRRVTSRRSVAHADDMAVADENRGLAIGNRAVLQLRRARHDEELIVVHVELG